jgi:transglutaminase-like putative cysteine protease
MPEVSAATSPVERFFQASLLGLVTSGYLAVAGSGYLDAPTLVLTAAGLVLRGLLVAGWIRARFPEWAVTAVTLAYAGFYPLDYLYVSRGFLEATVHLVFFVAVVKIVTAATPRDYAFAAAISFLELLAAALVSIHWTFFLFLALYLLCAVAAFMSAEIRAAIARHLGPSAQVARGGLTRFPSKLAVLTVVFSLGVLALTAGLFFLLPRTANAAFHLVSHRIFVPGFSNQVTLGQIGEIKRRSDAVMHVRLYTPAGAPPPQASGDAIPFLKWRGAALSTFDGRRWFNPPGGAETLRTEGGRVILAGDGQRRRPGRRVAYLVDLRPMDTDVLFFAGIPEVLNLNQPSVLHDRGEDTFRLPYGPVEGFRYEAYSYLPSAEFQESDGAPELPPSVRERHLQLPALDPRVRILAQDLAAGKSAPFDRAEAIERRLRADYGYTLDLPDAAPADPLADFLFERKKGHCEYFASAMAVMLRTDGIPSRIATGFLGGSFNPISGFYVVRAADAHSWVEAWLPGRGWTAFDPTPPDPAPKPMTLWTRLYLYADAAETLWQEWVVGYDLGRQVSLAGNIDRATRRLGGAWWERAARGTLAWGGAIRGWSARYAGWAAAAGCLALLTWYLWPSARLAIASLFCSRRVRRGQAAERDATLLYVRFLSLVRKRGFEKPVWLTPSEFAPLLKPPEVQELARDFTAAYNEFRFGGRTDRAPRMVVLLERIQRLPRHGA